MPGRFQISSREILKDTMTDSDHDADEIKPLKASLTRLFAVYRRQSRTLSKRSSKAPRRAERQVSKLIDDDHLDLSRRCALCPTLPGPFCSSRLNGQERKPTLYFTSNSQNHSSSKSACSRLTLIFSWARSKIA